MRNSPWTMANYLFRNLRVSMRLFWFFLSNHTVDVYTESKPDIHHDIEYRHILKASFDDDKCVLTVAYLTKKKKSLHLIVVEGHIDQSQADHAAEWCESVMKAVYDGEAKLFVPSFQIINATKAFGIKRSRRFMVFVNPYGGRVRYLRDIYLTRIASCILRKCRRKLSLYFRKKSSLLWRLQVAHSRFTVSARIGLYCLFDWASFCSHYSSRTSSDYVSNFVTRFWCSDHSFWRWRGPWNP